MEDLTETRDPIESLRAELRDAILAGRKNRRREAVDKNRTALGECTETDFYTVEFVVSMAQKLRKKSLDVQSYRKLQNALIQSEENINAFLGVENAVRGLVNDASGRSVSSKLAAINCCCNIALGNMKACTTICKNVSPYLVRQLGSSNYPIIEVCLLTIGNFIRGSEKAYSILLAQCSFKSLITLADNCPSTILPSVSYAALHYLYAGCEKLPTNEKVDLVRVLVKRISGQLDTDTIWLLALLSSLEECLDHLISIAPFVVELLFKVTDTSQMIAALRIVGNTVSEPSGRVAQYFIEASNQEKIEKFLTHSCIPLRKETLWLLGNLYNHPSPYVQSIITKELLTSSALKLAIASVKESC